MFAIKVTMMRFLALVTLAVSPGTVIIPSNALTQELPFAITSRCFSGKTGASHFCKSTIQSNEITRVSVPFKKTNLPKWDTPGKTPTLITTSSPHRLINWSKAHYYFTLNLPASSPESLGKITIQQQEKNLEIIQFNLSKIIAFQGTQNDQGQALNLQVTQDSENQTIEIIFEHPVPPGTTFTIRLQAYRNPSRNGVYLFRVRAFPSEDSSMGLYLGSRGLDLGVGKLVFERNF